MLHVQYDDNRLDNTTLLTIFAVEIFTSKMKVVLLLSSFVLLHEV